MPFSLVDSADRGPALEPGRRVPERVDRREHDGVARRVSPLRAGTAGLVPLRSSSAERLFLAALSEDSTFAMAAYYAARVSTKWPDMLSRLHM
jgi:hypothetical protein